MRYITRTTSVTILPENEPLFSEMATTVIIVDEAGGEFLEVAQSGKDEGKIRIDPREWPELRKAIDQMIGECRPVKNEK